MSNDYIGFIGGGNMARALAGGLVSSGYPPGLLMIADPDERRRAILEHDLGPAITSRTGVGRVGEAVAGSGQGE